MDVPVHLQTLDSGSIFQLRALLDSGCTGSCIDKEFIRKNDIRTRKIPRPIPVYNTDGTLNEGGPITEFVEMRMVGHTRPCRTNSTCSRKLRKDRTVHRT
jgi:hypothetical protein